MKMKQKKPSVIPPTAPAAQPLSYQYHDFLLDRQPELLDALRRDATAGRANAQYLMGMMYAEGHHLPQDTELALHWLERAAKQGHLDAQLDLGLLCLESGDAEGGRQWLIIAGAGGSVQAQYQLFRYYFEGQYGAPDYSQAMEWLEWAAQGGVVEAQDALGSLYLYGENVPEDRKKARYWLRKAAAKSLPQAQYHLGLLYLSEPAPTTRQRNSGLQWLGKAARANFAQAQFMLGVYLLQGNASKADIVEARFWLEQATMRGITDAAEYLQKWEASSAAKKTE